jgi:hypothetical protein
VIDVRSFVDAADAAAEFSLTHLGFSEEGAWVEDPSGNAVELFQPAT